MLKSKVLKSVCLTSKSTELYLKEHDVLETFQKKITDHLLKSWFIQERFVMFIIKKSHKIEK